MVPLSRLLLWLLKNGSGASLWLLRELLCWASWVLESGSLWREADPDCLSIPVPMGRKRVKRINPHLLNAIGFCASEGLIAKTGARIARILTFAKRRRGGAEGMGRTTANDSQRVRAKRYRECAQDAFEKQKVRILSLATDASRISGKETLVTAMCDPLRQVSCWCVPMVPRAK